MCACCWTKSNKNKYSKAHTRFTHEFDVIEILNCMRAVKFLTQLSIKRPELVPHFSEYVVKDVEPID